MTNRPRNKRAEEQKDKWTKGALGQGTKGSRHPTSRWTNRPRDWRDKEPKGQGPMGQGSTRPRDQRAKEPKGQGTNGPRPIDQGTRGPRDQNAKQPKGQWTEGPKDQRAKGPSKFLKKLLYSSLNQR